MADLQTKQALGYRKATDSKRCENCDHMHPDGTCSRVEGLVAPEMVCHAWAPERSLHSE